MDSAEDAINRGEKLFDERGRKIRSAKELDEAELARQKNNRYLIIQNDENQTIEILDETELRKKLSSGWPGGDLPFVTRFGSSRWLEYGIYVIPIREPPYGNTLAKLTPVEKVIEWEISKW